MMIPLAVPSGTAASPSIADMARISPPRSDVFVKFVVIIFNIIAFFGVYEVLAMFVLVFVSVCFFTYLMSVY